MDIIFEHSSIPIQSGDNLNSHWSDAGGNLEIVVGDLQNPTDVKKALVGIDIVFHIGPSLHPHEDAIGKNVINEAKSAGVSHFILSSYCIQYEQNYSTIKSKSL